MGKLNWKSEKDYEFTGGLSNAEWAWEFLRRLPEYHDDWITANDQQETFSAYQSDNPLNIHRNPFVMFDPPLPEGISPDDWAFREGVEFYGPLRGYGSKWRLRGSIQDPADPAPPKFEQIASAKLLAWNETEDHFAPVAEDTDFFEQSGHIAVIGIDLTRPLNIIATDVKELVKQEHKRREVEREEQRKIKNKKNWPIFLRVLDGLAAGETQANIGKHLLPDKADLQDANIAINQYIHNNIPRFADPDELLRLANTPD